MENNKPERDANFMGTRILIGQLDVGAERVSFVIRWRRGWVRLRVSLRRDHPWPSFAGLWLA